MGGGVGGGHSQRCRGSQTVHGGSCAPGAGRSAKETTASARLDARASPTLLGISKCKREIPPLQLAAPTCCSYIIAELSYGQRIQHMLARCCDWAASQSVQPLAFSMKVS